MQFTVADAYAALPFEYAGAIFRGQVVRSLFEDRDFIFRRFDEFIIVNVKLDYEMVPDKSRFWRMMGAFRKKFKYVPTVSVLNGEQFAEAYRSRLDLLWGGYANWILEARKRASVLFGDILADEVTFWDNGKRPVTCVKYGGQSVVVDGRTGNVDWGIDDGGDTASYFPMTISFDGCR